MLVIAIMVHLIWVMPLMYRLDGDFMKKKIAMKIATITVIVLVVLFQLPVDVGGLL